MNTVVNTVQNLYTVTDCTEELRARPKAIGWQFRVYRESNWLYAELECHLGSIVNGLSEYRGQKRRQKKYGTDERHVEYYRDILALSRNKTGRDYLFHQHTDKRFTFKWQSHNIDTGEWYDWYACKLDFMNFDTDVIKAVAKIKNHADCLDDFRVTPVDVLRSINQQFHAVRIHYNDLSSFYWLIQNDYREEALQAKSFKCID